MSSSTFQINLLKNVEKADACTNKEVGHSCVGYGPAGRSDLTFGISYQVDHRTPGVQILKEIAGITTPIPKGVNPSSHEAPRLFRVKLLAGNWVGVYCYLNDWLIAWSLRQSW